MKVEFDPAKDAANKAKHGLSLVDLVRMDWRNVDFVPDIRREYGEPRFQVYGNIDGRLHVLVVTLRGEGLRAISLRKANNREIRRHGRPSANEP